MELPLPVKRVISFSWTKCIAEAPLYTHSETLAIVSFKGSIFYTTLRNIGRTDREQIRSRINNNDCRTFRPRRPLSTAYKTREDKRVLYAVDKGLRGRNVLQSLLLILLRICSRSVCPILTSSNEPLQHH